MATEIALLLRGKNRPDFSPHLDTGALVIVQNIKDAKITGTKGTTKRYYRHSGYLGGLKEERLADAFEKYPEKVLQRAVLGMLPKTRLQNNQIKRLKIK